MGALVYDFAEFRSRVNIREIKPKNDIYKHNEKIAAEQYRDGIRGLNRVYKL